ncbi:MAG: di-trans,poly-cis-decaprenylcistransferase [Candidatus Magasanikbacteria bacterium CG_4_9_14_0_2_um_filter_41_10]|uniref:Isoprenyl transferase n=1 Tax=Candidatus Magasanikbacteria bacterium CG_4_10_14_0_2_um_filter_41_31 TaxID=1974639 RepID=A0A2M7V5D9_9BACT|nr:MAG: di-trans,poly-cis-decaprenylcistransferase [Candidatus Magasanikbacteria bacterium CG1_02_41_34]PIZ93820.1 MAG: di-trans,poly-cis-decaprenylcistransferase [Candidatus Magasanikbacteria bacterium CG_4_10_14_0_2_um_filter_41_31]PJC53662.1 MAG: di-trans,poly-cis-decaprenylcistransferase [Candidatus Magasanikbacteria bacterium CG_4_9_14_0_2_um_filter_41_10]
MSASHKLQHIAFIMDGNRRWAKQRLMPTAMGHAEGAKTLKKIAKAVKAREIPYMTVYALSTENLNRSKEELDYLFSLFGKLVDQFGDLVKENVRLKILGNMDLLPQELAEKLKQVEKDTKDHKSMTLSLAIAYGGRDEIVRAIKKIKDPSTATEESLEALLDMHDIPDVDVIIRTGGHHRLSNFLMWKSAYAELIFTDTYWPAFEEKELDDILAWYEVQERKFGK